MSVNSAEASFAGWAVLELMGHIRTAGLVTEEERFGAKVGRCDVPRADGGFTTFFFGGSSLFRMTPCSEEAARAVAKGNEPRPVHQWELPRPGPGPGQERVGRVREDDEDFGRVFAGEDGDEEPGDEEDKL